MGFLLSVRACTIRLLNQVRNKVFSRCPMILNVLVATKNLYQRCFCSWAVLNISYGQEIGLMSTIRKWWILWVGFKKGVEVFSEQCRGVRQIWRELQVHLGFPPDPPLFHHWDFVMNEESCWGEDSTGSPSWTRTSDPMINSHLLYQLSYWGTHRKLINIADCFGSASSF